MLWIFTFINQKEQKKPTQHLTTSKQTTVDTHQQRLPIYHSFVNAPVMPTPLQNPVNVYVQGNPFKT